MKALALLFVLSISLVSNTSFTKNASVFHTCFFEITPTDTSAVAPDMDKAKLKKEPANKPEFSGGHEALLEFFQANINYYDLPFDYQKAIPRIQIGFVVQKDGRISNFEVQQDKVPNDLKAELIRVMKQMPKWMPATNKRGKARHSTYSTTIPLNFPIDHSGNTENKTAKKPFPNEEEETIIDFSERSPEFPGGEEAMIQFISDNLNLDNVNKEDQVYGVVYVKFTVEKTGEITKIKIGKGVNDSMNQEAIRVISAMPNWVPGMLYGKPCSYVHSLPIEFDF